MELTEFKVVIRIRGGRMKIKLTPTQKTILINGLIVLSINKRMVNSKIHLIDIIRKIKYIEVN